MGTHFSQFHSILYPHITVRNGLTIPSVYSNLFSWTIPSDWLGVDSSDAEGPYYSAPQVTRWVAGKEELPMSILQQASNNMDAAADTYGVAFYDLIYKQLKLSGQSVEMLDADMKRFLDTFPISFFSLDNGPETNNAYYPASYGLVTALVYDRIGKDGKTKKKSLLDSELYMEINRVLETCWNKNVEFSTPCLLDILFHRHYPILRYALDVVRDGLGEKWAKKISLYINQEPHEPFSGESQGVQEAIFLAKVVAASDHHLDARTSSVATKGTMCRALPFCRKSRFIAEMWHEIKANHVELARWQEIIEMCESVLCVAAAPPMNGSMSF